MRLTTDEILSIKLNLFKFGVILVEDSDSYHPELINISQKKILSYVRWLISKKYVTKIFAWNHAYIKLTDEGVNFLIEDLCAREYELPITHSQNVREVIETEEIREEVL